MTLDARRLQIFLAVAEHAGIGRAAAELGLTQPAVTRALHRLELDLGAPLVERHSTGVRLTEFGRTLLPRARSIEEESQRAVEEIRTMQGRGRGTLRLGAVSSLLAHVLPRAVDGLLARHPGMEVRIVEGVEDRLVEALVAGEIDLAVSGELDADDRVAPVGSLRWRDHVVVVAAGRHPLREHPGLELADLVPQRWVMPPRRTEPRRTLVEMFRRAGLEAPRVTVTTRSITALKALVADAGFLSVMPRPLFSAERAAGTIEALAVPGGTRARRFGVYRRRGGVLPLPAEALVEELRPVIVAVAGEPRQTTTPPR
ncbi:LysR family transcriptional regulator [Microbispora sp. H10836]|uniref:LysR family transcriptional regulator n=1 Tax=Microbispora sp. H10836 TaxID=2729106 RepID=UPI0014753DD2|nr:LysR family transcriptional regulator [Microbispora sp. H10836]